MSDDVAARIGEAIRLQQTGQPGQALAIVDELVKTHPDDAGILNLQGGLRAQNGDTAGAIQPLQRAVAINPNPKYRQNLAILLLQLGQHAAAEPHFRVLHAEWPDDHSILFSLGALLRRMRRYAEAEPFLRRYVEMRPRAVEGGNELGAALEGMGRTEDAVETFRRSIELAGPSPGTYYNLGNALRDLNRPAEAITAYDAALAIQPEFAEAHVQRAFANLMICNFRDGWAEYAWRWRIPGFGSLGATPPIWRGEPLSGKRIVVRLEQGFGDTFQFIRYAKLLAAAGAEVVALCTPAQQDIARAADGVGRAAVAGERLPPMDFQVGLLDLPHLFGTTLETVPANVPYIRADPAKIAAWRDIVGAGPGPAIGVFWRGSPDIRGKPGRTCPSSALRSLFTHAGIRCFSLQKDRAPSEPLPPGVTDLAPHLADWTETAAAITVLDGVVGIDTAQIHLAGALGRPGILMLPTAGDWRWLLGRADSPWYPSLRIVRQPAPGDWSGAVAGAVALLGGWPEESSGRTG